MKGIIHVGANNGIEYQNTKRLTILFEPQQKVFDELVKLHGENPNVIAFNTALGADNSASVKMYTAKNSGLSSSLLKPLKHLEIMPQIEFDGSELVPMTTLDHCLKEAALENTCSEMIIDVQGYELEVLKGAVETLKSIRRIKVEINREELYEGCVQFKELELFLKEHGFVCVLEDWYGGSWGDAIFEKL